MQWLHLAPHPTSARASREFVTRTLLDWRLGRVIRFASLVVGELVTGSMMKVGTDIDLSVAWNHAELRLTVRDRSPSPSRQRQSPLGLHGRGLTVVAGLSRAFGILPTADGGKVVWAVLQAPRQPLSITEPRSEPGAALQEGHTFTDPLRYGLPATARLAQPVPNLTPAARQIDRAIGLQP